MKILRKGIAVTLAAAMVITMVPSNGADAAKKIALNKKKAEVTVGSTLKLKVKNAKKNAKITWKTSNKKVAKIAKKTTKGNAAATVKGVKKGKAVITAAYTAGKKKGKLKCTVTVKKKGAVNTPAVTNTAATGTPVITNTPALQATATPAATSQTQHTPGPTGEPTPTPTPKPTAKPTPSADAQIYKTTTDIVVDGTIDNAWGFVMSLPISNWKAEEGKTAKTSNASAKIMWTAKNLYVLVEAEDSDINAKKDSVDLFVDEYNNKEEWGAEKKKNEFQYRTMIDTEAKNPGSLVEGKNQWDGEDITTAVCKTDKGYIVEYAIPLHAAPVEEKYIGIEIQINDASADGINGTWNLFANPAKGDKYPSESTLVFGECQYAIRRQAREIELDFSNPNSTDMQLPDQFSKKDENGNIQYFDEDGETVLSTQIVTTDDDGNTVITYQDKDGKVIAEPVGKRIAEDGVMNTKARYDVENGLVYCETANNIVIYFPGGTKVFKGEKASVKIEGTYTLPAAEEGADPVEVADGDTVFRTWLVDTENHKLKGDSPVTTSNQVLVTYGEIKSEDGTFKYEGSFKADGPDKPANDGYESDGTCDAIMIKAPSYNSTIGNLVLKKVTFVVYDEVKNEDNTAEK